jgi:hypothetical protein
LTFGFAGAGAGAAFFFFATTTPGKLFFFPAAPVFFGTGGARGLEVGAAVVVEVDVEAVVEASEGEREGESEEVMAGGAGAVERFVTALRNVYCQHTAYIFDKKASAQPATARHLNHRKDARRTA